MTSEPLVPRGLPSGERQNTVAAMQQAGVPLSPAARPNQRPQGVPSRPGGPGQLRTGVNLLSDTTPADFPFLQAPQSEPAPEQPGNVLDSLAASAQSSFAQAVLARLQTR